MREVVLTPPPSKSDAQRALVLGELLGVPVELGPEPLPTDVAVLRDGLRALAEPSAEIDCRDGGAPFRFLLTQAALRPSRLVRFTGSARLGARPRAALFESLTRALGPLGLELTSGAPWPVQVTTSSRVLEVTRFEATGGESSQFASSLLLGAARVAHLGERSVEVALTGPLTSRGYFELTRRWVERAGFHVEGSGSVVTVKPGRQAALPPIPGDWSSLTYLLPLAWRSGGRVEHLTRGSGHPDERVLSLLATIGLELRADGRVEGTARGVLELDAAECPDAVPALVALACASGCRATVRNTSVLRAKESDRVEGLVTLVTAVGGSARATDTTLRVEASKAWRSFAFDCLGDHRLAMAAATLAYLTGVGLELKGGASVAKSFPGFWSELRKVDPQASSEGRA